jgi:hypothetical protein
LFGEHDVAAMNDEDHRMIARVVNRYRPGTADFVQIEKADHFMVLTPTMEPALETQAVPERLSPQLITELAGWIERTLTKPPVASRFPPVQAAQP